MPEPLVIAPQGDLDISTVDDFRGALTEAAARAEHAVVVDLTEVDFVDSSGLGALVELYARLRRDGRELAVVAPGGSAAAVLLNLTGMQARLPVLEARPPVDP